MMLEPNLSVGMTPLFTFQRFGLVFNSLVLGIRQEQVIKFLNIA
jgi:hypothetical protein